MTYDDFDHGEDSCIRTVRTLTAAEQAEETRREIAARCRMIRANVDLFNETEQCALIDEIVSAQRAGDLRAIQALEYRVGQAVIAQLANERAS